MKNSKIEWCDHTFNPWIGCTKVSPGCANCYAESLTKRTGLCKWGKGEPRRRTSATYWKQPLRWNKLAGLGKFRQCDTCGNREFRKWDATIPPGGLACCSTLGCLSLPESDSFAVRPRVFSASLADWLDDEVPIEWLADLFRLIHQTPNLDWLLLTKRPQNFKDRISRAQLTLLEKADDPVADSLLRWWIGHISFENVWIGTTVENQEMADKRIPELLNIPAKIRFLSCEPLLGNVRILDHLMSGSDPGKCGSCGKGHGFTRCRNYGEIAKENSNVGCTSFKRVNFGIHWVIVGGESGHGARPMHPDWVKSLRRQCERACVPFLFKQWGEWFPGYTHDGGFIFSDDHDGEHVEECIRSARFKVFEFPPEEDGTYQEMALIGKTRSGRILDGTEHNEFPT